MRQKLQEHLDLIRANEYLKILTLRTIGNFLVLSSLFMIGKTFYQPVKEEVRYAFETAFAKKYIVAGENTADTLTRDFSSTQPPSGLAKLLNVQQLEVLMPADPNYSIVIPKIGANAKIIPNVNPADEKEYLDVLKRGVAQALGTAFPGEGGHMFLFAHSTDYFWNVGTYNAIFYLLYKLETGDEINLFYKGQRYVYKVTGKIEVDPSDVQYLTRKTDSEFLTLQTCWPPGTTLKRMLVFAERKTE